MIKVFDNQKSYDDYIDYINSQRGQILGNSRQDPRKFKFNTPKDSYIYSNSNYSKNAILVRLQVRSYAQNLRLVRG